MVWDDQKFPTCLSNASFASCVPAHCPNPHFRAVEFVLVRLKADTEPLPPSTPHSSVVLFAAAGIFPTGKYDDLF